MRPATPARRVEVTDVGLDRTDARSTARRSVRRRTPGSSAATSIGSPEGGARSVGLDVADAVSADVSHGQGLRDDGRLAGDAWRGEADLVTPVVVDGGSAYDGVDDVAVTKCFGQPLQHDGRHAAPVHATLGACVERSAVTVRRRDATLDMVIAGLDGTRMRPPPTMARSHSPASSV